MAIPHQPYGPTDLRGPTRWLVAAIDASARLPKGRAICAATGAFSLTTVLNIACKGHLNPFLLYYLTTFFAAWSLGQVAGLGFALAAALAITLVSGATYAAGAADTVTIAMIWNVAARLLTFGMLALLAGALREVVDRERRRAATDPLTGVLNGEAFRERSAALVDDARRSGAAVVLAYMDLDGFKSVNDRHGHSAGDRVLKAFAQGADGALRAGDLFARVGGDEFVAMLAVPGCEEGDRMAERLHARLSGVLRDTGFPVTCSMGAMVARASSLKGGEWLIEGADQLMYEVKRSGRNALRLARFDRLGLALRNAYRIEEDNAFAHLLDAIDAGENMAADMPMRKAA